jgi:hypothetical protein
MKDDYTGPGCLGVCGLLFFGAALYFLVGGVLGGGEHIGDSIPWVIATVAVGMFILSVSDARERISRIEKHLGIGTDDQNENEKSDSNNTP